MAKGFGESPCGGKYPDDDGDAQCKGSSSMAAIKQQTRADRLRLLRQKFGLGEYSPKAKASKAKALVTVQRLGRRIRHRRIRLRRRRVSGGGHIIILNPWTRWSGLPAQSPSLPVSQPAFGFGSGTPLGSMVGNVTGAPSEFQGPKGARG